MRPWLINSRGPLDFLIHCISAIYSTRPLITDTQTSQIFGAQWWMLGAWPSAAKSNKRHYQFKVFVCVSVISGCVRIIAKCSRSAYNFTHIWSLLFLGAIVFLPGGRVGFTWSESWETMDLTGPFSNIDTECNRDIRPWAWGVQSTWHQRPNMDLFHGFVRRFFKLHAKK